MDIDAAMDQGPVNTVPAQTPANGDPGQDLSSIGSSDQACKECRRRKARCNRALPTCDLCTKYRRHCLYEKHARTPLTRRHLTEVEARLEKAEAMVRQMQTLIPPHLCTWVRKSPPTVASLGQPDPDFDFSSAPQPPINGVDGSREPVIEEAGDIAVEAAPSRRPLSVPQAAKPQYLDQQRGLESPPVDDFEWCEQTTSQIHGLSPESGAQGPEKESPISDGMASLTVNDQEAGYLGVASGAALLRLLEPASRRRMSSKGHQSAPLQFPLAPQINPNRHVAESMIDAYFRLYHVSYPIIHEPSFRAQYSEVIPRPNGTCWTILAYVVAAIGVWASGTTATDSLDLALFQQAASILDFNFLEVGNLSLVQALTLASNYQQKRDKPNSGYNYLGLAVRMAMGIGLHKEFQGWNISPLNMEIRRRVWWSLCVFDVGATITFSRPDVWPYQGVDVAFPLNVNDKDLTAASTTYPPESDQMTPYTAVSTQARFHIATHECYNRIISRPFPSAAELLEMENTLVEPWRASIPPFFKETTVVPARYALCQAILSWRFRNLRIILYRPFVIRRALRRRTDADIAGDKAYDRCLDDAKTTIEMIGTYWSRNEHNRLAAWYGLYFLFQAALIPCICLRNDPTAPMASEWRAQLNSTLQTVKAMAPTNGSSDRCYQIISDLCGRYLYSDQGPEASDQAQRPVTSASNPVLESQIGDGDWLVEEAVGESPQTQINNVFSMMWPNAQPVEAAEIVMGDDAGWMEFLRLGDMEDWTESTGT